MRYRSISSMRGSRAPLSQWSTAFQDRDNGGVFPVREAIHHAFGFARSKCMPEGQG